MTSIPAKDILHSAIAVGDWFLSCQKFRDKARFEKIFNKLLDAFRESRVDEEAYSAFVDALGDVFDILAEGKTAAEGGRERFVGKTFQDLSAYAQDYLMFLFVFAKHLDSLHEETHNEQHVIEVINAVNNLEPRKVNDTHPPEEFPEFRLGTMMAGFNFLSPESVYRYDALIIILEFAEHHKLFYKLSPYIHEFEDWIFKHCQLISADRRFFYLKLIKGIKQLPKNSKDLFKFYKRLIKEYDTDIMDLSAYEESENEAAAVELMTLALSIIDIVTFDDLFNSKSIQKLSQTTHAQLYQLGLIFYQGNCVDFQNFVVHHPNIFEQYKLNQAQCMEKLQLIELSSMPPVFDEQTQLYDSSLDEIAKKLNIPAQQAERLAIKAIGLKFIDGRINQMRRTIEIRSNLYRTFKKEEWAELKSKLLILQSHLLTIQNELTQQATPRIH